VVQVRVCVSRVCECVCLGCLTWSCVACPRSVPLCPSPAAPGLYLSRDLRGPFPAVPGAATAACAVAGGTRAAPDAVPFSLPVASLLPGALYVAVGYRSAGSDVTSAPAFVRVGVDGVFDFTSAFVGSGARALRGAAVGARVGC
jgi:hypothetical protein